MLSFHIKENNLVVLTNNAVAMFCVNGLGGGPIKSAMPRGSAAVGPLYHQVSLPQSLSPFRGPEQSGGPDKQIFHQSSQMVSLTRYNQVHFPGVGDSLHRPVCSQNQQEVSSVLCTSKSQSRVP